MTEEMVINIINRIKYEVDRGCSITLARKNAGCGHSTTPRYAKVTSHPKYCEVLNYYLEKGNFIHRYENKNGILHRIKSASKT